MNEVIENMLTRHSCRAFEHKKIADKDLNEIMLAAINAPTAMNKQAWIFTVLTNREMIQELAKVMGEALGKENYDMYDPEVLVIPSTPKEVVYGVDDNACALENIFLAAHSLGIGSCWINQMRQVCDDPKIREILSEFGIPEDHTVYGMAALGYPASEPREIERVGIVRYVS